MIDYIAFSLPDTMVPPLQDMQISWRGHTRGKLRNLNVIQYQDSIFCNGSIAKFHQGENVTTLSRQGLKEAFLELESQTGWILRNAEIKQIEIGCTMPVESPVGDYLRCIGRLPRYKLRTVEGATIESVTNTTGTRSFIAYDKALEAKRTIPELYSDMHLIRLELKYKKVQKEIGIISPWDITEKEVYGDLVKRFASFYFSVPKKRESVLDISEKCTPKDIINLLTVAGYQHYGRDLMNRINSLERTGKVSRADRVRKTLENLNSEKKLTEPDLLIQELDSKVTAQVQFY